MSMQTRLYAPDISCNHCAMTIERELSRVEGVISVTVDVPSKSIDLEYANDEALEHANAVLEEIGYPAANK